MTKGRIARTIAWLAPLTPLAWGTWQMEEGTPASTTEARPGVPTTPRATCWRSSTATDAGPLHLWAGSFSSTHLLMVSPPLPWLHTHTQCHWLQRHTQDCSVSQSVIIVNEPGGWLCQFGGTMSHCDIVPWQVNVPSVGSFLCYHSFFHSSIIIKGNLIWISWSHILL